MVSRRRILAGLAATSLLPATGWSSVGTPDYLSAARLPSGAYILAGLTRAGDITFKIPLPGRGHAAAAHPERAEAVAFARRPGTFALVLDCRDGSILSTLTAPKGRHFYGHGTFSTDGKKLFTSENDFEAGTGVIGVWDATQRYRRLGEFGSGGVGPHDLRLLPDGASLAVANGGIETHPDTGRAKLNIPVMQPDLSYMSLDGTLQERVTLGASLHKNSIRHLAIRADGLVAFAMQWQGDTRSAPPLLGVHAPGQTPVLLTSSPKDHATLEGYAGSIAFSGTGTDVAITSPRGNKVQIFDIVSQTMTSSHVAEDVCGVGPMDSGFLFTTGTGQVRDLQRVTHHDLQWDNHLIAL